MADTNSLILLENAVTGYLLRNKRSTEDYSTYLENACVLLQDYMTFDSTEGRTEKIAVSALGIIELPGDCIRVRDVAVYKDGEYWPFTERPDMVNTTTTTLGIEGHDATLGEGVALKDNETYGLGARGGVNEYYYTVDMRARRIFCDGIISSTAIVRYVSSGISVTGLTYIPSILIPMLDKYLYYKTGYWDGSRQSEIDAREKSFDKERLKIRGLLNSMTASQWSDLFYSLFNQSARR